jgi:hypothetical protein
MTTNLPSNRKQALEWIEARLPAWSDNPTGIGLTSAAVTDLTTKTTTARTSFVSVESVRQDALNATQTFYTDADAMHQAASPMIANIKNFADNATDPLAVYTAAEVSPASPRSPAPPPATPVISSAAINGDGSVTIGFNATGSAGTVWQVSRQLAGESAFTFVGNADVKSKSFVDTSLPAGSATASYSIQGVRGGLAGAASFSFEVKFGSAPAAASASTAAA